MAATTETIEQVEQATGKYKYGFVTDIESEKAPKGLDEDTIRFISAKKEEPEWMLEWRLKAFRTWQEMAEPEWAKLGYPEIDYQDAYYYAAPKKKPQLESLDELDPEIKAVYDKLGIPVAEQELLANVKGASNPKAEKKIAVDAVLSVAQACMAIETGMADVVALVMDSREAFEKQDLQIADFILREGRQCQQTHGENGLEKAGTHQRSP